jgi:uncharacterized protein YdhG (YjbR/CyaY superfamily)
VDRAVQGYIDDIDKAYRPLFDRLQALALHTHPEAEIVLSYGIPTYTIGKRRLHVGVWQHGVSLYGWQKDRAAAFLSRHPELQTSTGTIRLRPEDATSLSDAELIELIRAALDS